MVAARSAHKRRIPRIAYWALFVLVAVVVIPMSAYFLGGRPLDIPVAKESSDSAVLEPLTYGHPYAVRHSLTVPIGADGVELLESVPGPAGPLALMTVLPAADNGAWMVDLLPERDLVSRVRRVDAMGDTLSTFEVPVGLALAAAGRSNDIWLGFAAIGDASSEIVRRYDASGDLLGTYTIPEGAFARSLTVTPENELWVQLEEYANLAEELASSYRSSLVPVAVGPDLIQAESQTESSLDGSFYGEDGLRYVVESELIPYAGDFAFPEAVVTAYDGENAVATIATPKGWRPFGADVDGHVFCEPLPVPSPSESIGYELIGEPAVNTLEVRAYDQAGLWTRFSVQQPRLLNDFAPLLRMSGSDVLALRVDDEGINVLRLAASSVSAERAAIDTLAPQLTLVAGPNVPTTGDPYRARDDAERDVWQLVHAGLVRSTPDGGTIADLAEEIPTLANGGISADGRTITYAIAPNRTWHDGSPVSAADVVATWEYLSAPGPVPFTLFPGAEYISTVSAHDNRVVVTLTQPYGPAAETFFPYVFPAAGIADNAAAVNAPIWSLPVGAGPYQVINWATDGRLELEAANEATSISRIDVVFAREESALAAFQGSQSAAVWLRVPDRLTLDVERDGVGSVLAVPTGYWRGMVFDEADPILSDPAVRRALVLATPHDSWAELFPQGSLAAVSVFAHATQVDAAGDAEPDFDAARQVLERAGWRDGDGDGVREKNGVVLEVGFALGIRDGRDEVSFEELEPIEAAWREIGIKPGRQFGATFFYAPWYSNGYLSVGRHQVGVGVFPSPIDPAVGSLFDPVDVPGAGNQFGLSVARTRDRELAELHDRARAEADSAVRGDIGSQVLDRVNELDLMVSMRPDVRFLSVIGEIDGFAPAPYPAGTLWNVAEWTLDTGTGE